MYDDYCTSTPDEIQTASDSSSSGSELDNRLVCVMRDAPMPEPYLSNLQSGFRLILGRENGIEILAGMPGLDASEIHAARKAPVRIGLLRQGDALFLVADIKGLATVDMPYDHALPPQHLRGLPERSLTAGFFISLILADTSTGTVRALRGFTVTPRFSSVMEAELAYLDGRVGAPDWSYKRDVELAYRKWPTSNQMLASARIKETAGKPFPAQRVHRGHERHR